MQIRYWHSGGATRGDAQWSCMLWDEDRQDRADLPSSGFTSEMEVLDAIEELSIRYPEAAIIHVPEDFGRPIDEHRRRAQSGGIVAQWLFVQSDARPWKLLVGSETPGVGSTVTEFATKEELQAAIAEMQNAHPGLVIREA